MVTAASFEDEDTEGDDGSIEGIDDEHEGDEKRLWI